jgi:hypothetical protein
VPVLKSSAGRQSSPISTDATPSSGSADADVSPRGGVRVHASFAFPDPPKRSVAAAIVSALLHLLVILLAIRLTQAVVEIKNTPAGNAIMRFMGGGGGGGGAGGASFTALAKPPPPPPPTVAETPVVIPKVEVVPDKIPPPETPTQAKADTNHSASTAPAAAGTGGGSGGGEGTGTGTGKGSGVGPGSGSGTGGGDGGGNGGFPPVGKQMILPPTEGVPKELRGVELEVVFFVTATGTVSDLRVKPEIKNKDFAKKFDTVMRGYTFVPARNAAGEKVAGTSVYTVTMGNH